MDSEDLSDVRGVKLMEMLDGLSEKDFDKYIVGTLNKRRELVLTKVAYNDGEDEYMTPIIRSQLPAEVNGHGESFRLANYKAMIAMRSVRGEDEDDLDLEDFRSCEFHFLVPALGNIDVGPSDMIQSDIGR
jgi:hypothetical protein